MLLNGNHLAPEWLCAILACPACGGDLVAQPGVIRCKDCDLASTQGDSRVLNLLPDRGLPDNSQWQDRQREMTRAYDELVVDREHSILAYHSDFNPMAPLLESITGRVLDVGGGNGIARHWLPGSPESAEYVTLDPSPTWLDQPWHTIADVFPCLNVPPLFVRGVAEQAPFSEASFDGALAIWSLNHTFDPEEALRSTARVLKDGGRLLLVLDDVPASWADIFLGHEPRRSVGERIRAAVGRLRWSLSGAPIQPDHLRIEESDLARWIEDDFTNVRRMWIGAYLIYELERRRA